MSIELVIFSLIVLFWVVLLRADIKDSQLKLFGKIEALESEVAMLRAELDKIRGKLLDLE